MSEIEFFPVNSLEKVFLEKRPVEMERPVSLSVLGGEIPCMQVAYRYQTDQETWWLKPRFSVTAEGSPGSIRVRTVEVVPSDFPCYPRTDDNYLTTEPGLFPDLLRPVADHVFEARPGGYRSLWVDFPEAGEAGPGTYRVKLKFTAWECWELRDGGVQRNPQAETMSREVEISIEILPARLPEQTTLHTEWFYADCLADYYHTEPFSEQHWEILDRFIEGYAREHGGNMILTPVFTPPLDTAVNGERTTVQLVAVEYEEKEGYEYQFEFSDLERWCTLCRKHGISYLEIPPFFTQWGAVATPKIVGKKDGRYHKLFGWDVRSDSPVYREFLKALLPRLQEKLKEWGYDKEHVYYHISDEPGMGQTREYQNARNQVADLLEGCPTIDAIGHYEFYEQGMVMGPVVSNDSIQPFLDHKVPDLWVYYCCAQHVQVPNRFFAMPSARNRIMGVLIYLYDIRGFLHWGYNFYNSQFSLKRIDPFAMTHAEYGFPSGDAYLVYPGEDGKPLSSIRSEVQRAVFEDIRAFQCLEGFIGKESVKELILKEAGGTLTFRDYPRSAEYILELRRKVNDMIRDYTVRMENRKPQ